MDWRVTRSLVSYDKFSYDLVWTFLIEGSPDHWWVTTPSIALSKTLPLIEGSPDHWWVTTLIVGLVFVVVVIEGSPDHWWVTTTTIGSYMKTSYWRVTRSLVSYDLSQTTLPNVGLDWRVTRSLVSYDLPKVGLVFVVVLKGHQIIGELRQPSKHWYPSNLLLKGHQIIGELRPPSVSLLLSFRNWRVTRSLVSYDVTINLPCSFFFNWRVTRSLVSYDSLN